MELDKSQLFKVARIIQDGHYGSFMSAIGCALQLADDANQKKLSEAFGDVFAQIYTNAIKAEELNHA
jgi:hypothetical protein